MVHCIEMSISSPVCSATVREHNFRYIYIYNKVVKECHNRCVDNVVPVTGLRVRGSSKATSSRRCHQEC